MGIGNKTECLIVTSKRDPKSYKKNGKWRQSEKCHKSGIILTMNDDPVSPHKSPGEKNGIPFNTKVRMHYRD